MDVIVKKKNPLLSKKTILFAVTALFLVIVGLVTHSSTDIKVPASDIWIGTVKEGDIEESVSGFGRLKSKKTRLLTAYSNATVEEIVLKPGAMVEPNSIILRLADPQIEQAVKDAERALSQIKNQYLQLEINQKREILSQRSTLEVLQSSLESAELEVTAQSQLVKKGIVSNLDYQRGLLEQRQLTRRLKIETERIIQLTELHKANLAIAQSNITAQEEATDLVKKTKSRLIVKAGISGVMQSLSVELGQSVSSGQQLALVGSMSELYALLNIPQANMQHIAINQNVDIDTRSGLIKGNVTRIEPMVTNGNIQVEVSLVSELTGNARPELNISGTILIDTLKNVLYVKKPVNAQAYSNKDLYQLDMSGQSAHATTLQFGAETKDTIQIVSGASVDQRFILSDMSRWKKHTAIAIVQ